MDESARDIYNRFGSDALQFDPRTDELKLIVGLGMEYLFWGVCTYIFTLPPGARASRSWISILLIIMLIVEVFYRLTESVLPSWMPATLTEHELITWIHLFFPLLLAYLRILSEYLYLDINEYTASILIELGKQQKVRLVFSTLLAHVHGCKNIFHAYLTPASKLSITRVLG